MFFSLLQAIRQGSFSLAIHLFLPFDQSSSLFSIGAVLYTGFRLLKQVIWIRGSSFIIVTRLHCDTFKTQLSCKFYCYTVGLSHVLIICWFFGFFLSSHIILPGKSSETISKWSTPEDCSKIWLTSLYRSSILYFSFYFVNTIEKPETLTESRLLYYIGQTELGKHQMLKWMTTPEKPPQKKSQISSSTLGKANSIQKLEFMEEQWDQPKA